jgi:hypothetical protein
MTLHEQFGYLTKRLEEFSEDFGDLNQIFKRLIVDLGEEKNCNREEFEKFVKLIEGRFKN